MMNDRKKQVILIWNESFEHLWVMHCPCSQASNDRPVVWLTHHVCVWINSVSHFDEIDALFRLLIFLSLVVWTEAPCWLCQVTSLWFHCSVFLRLSLHQSLAAHSEVPLSLKGTHLSMTFYKPPMELFPSSTVVVCFLHTAAQHTTSAVLYSGL